LLTTLEICVWVRFVAALDAKHTRARRSRKNLPKHSLRCKRSQSNCRSPRIRGAILVPVFNRKAEIPLGQTASATETELSRGRGRPPCIALVHEGNFCRLCVLQTRIDHLRGPRRTAACTGNCERMALYWPAEEEGGARAFNRNSRDRIPTAGLCGPPCHLLITEDQVFVSARGRHSHRPNIEEGCSGPVWRCRRLPFKIGVAVNER